MGAAKIDPVRNLVAILLLEGELAKMDASLRRADGLGREPEANRAAMYNAICDVEDSIAVLKGEKDIKVNEGVLKMAKDIRTNREGYELIGIRAGQQLAKALLRVLD